MIRLLAALCVVLSLVASARSQQVFPTSNGQYVVPGQMGMCLNLSGQAVPQWSAAGAWQCAGGTQTLFARIKLVTATFTPGTSYAAGNSFGGKLTFATGVVSGQVQIRRVAVGGSASTLTASANLGFFAFNANPSTTFTDGSAVVWNSADNANFATALAIDNMTAVNGQISNAYLSSVVSGAGTNAPPLPQTVNTDSSGNVYGALVSGGTWTMTTPAQFTLTIEIGY